jgi:hypothetical protein
MNGVVPVKVVIGVDSVPPTVVRLERVMCPALTRICAGNNDSLASESQRPHVRRVRVSNARFDRRRNTGCAGHQRRFLNRASLRKVIVNNRVACDARYVGTGRQRLGKLAVSFHQNCINDIERLRLDVAFAQPLKDWPLCALGLFQQGLINEAALFGFSWQIGCWNQIGLICEHDKKFRLLSVSSVFHYPRRDLAKVERVVLNALAGAANLNALADGVGRSDSSNERYSSCNEEQ